MSYTHHLQGAYATRLIAQEVLDRLGIKDMFVTIISGEEFANKDEVFRTLAHQMNPSTILSIGDQYQTDVLPAKVVGMSAIQVSPERSISYLKMLS